MKKFLLILLIAILCLCVFSCDFNQTQSDTPSDSVSDVQNEQSSVSSTPSDDSAEVSEPDESIPDESEDLSLWFNGFTDKYMQSSSEGKEFGTYSKDIVFNEKHGYAIQYPSFENDSADAEIENVIATLKSDFEAFASSLDTPTVLCVDYTSSQGASYGSVIFKIEYVNKEETTLKRFILTSCFEKDGTPVTTDTLFRESYREIVRDEMLLAFSKDEELAAKFTEHDIASITNESNMLSEFVLFDSSIDFLFLNSDGSIVAMNLPKTDIRTAFVNVTSIPRKLDPSKKMVAITYDDGPDRGITTRILDVLEQYGVVATFFELGEYIEGRESILRREVALGCEVGTHSWDHKNMLKHSLECLKKDKEQVDEVFKAALGYTPTLFRPPYGNVNDAIGEMHDMAVIGWTLDTLDWQKVSEGGRKDADALYNYFVAKHEAGKLDGQVVLMHAIYSTTAEATERVVPYLLDKGYQLVTVSELITYKLGKEVTPGVRYYSGYTIRDNKDCDCD